MWHLIESPFGRIAYTVTSDGGLYFQPHTHSAELRATTDHTTGETIMVPADAPYYNTNRMPDGSTATERPALVINGKRYGDDLGGFSARVEIRAQYGHEYPAPLLVTPYAQSLTESAYAKLSAWITEHYAAMATPERIAQAALSKARSDEHYAEKDWAQATAKLRDAQNAREAAAKRLSEIRAEQARETVSSSAERERAQAIADKDVTRLYCDGIGETVTHHMTRTGAVLGGDLRCAYCHRTAFEILMAETEAATSEKAAH